MKKWFFGRELLERWDCTPTELLSYMKAGLTPYDSIDRQIYDLDVLPRETLEEIKKIVPSDWVYHLFTVNMKPLSQVERESFFQSPDAIHENQERIPVIPPGHDARTFVLPIHKDEAIQLLEEIKSFRFKYQDVIDFEPNNALFVEEQGDYPPSKISDITAASAFASLPLDVEGLKPIKQTPFQEDKLKARQIAEEYIQDCKEGLPSIKEAVDLVKDRQAIPSEDKGKTTDGEDFMHSLSISYVNDNQISIIVGNKKAKEYTCQEMGFKQSSNTWKLLLKMLQDTDHTYNIGIYSADKDPVKNRSYNNAVKLLSNFSQKFVTFLNHQYSASLPTDFNVFKNMKGQDRAGTYRTKFRIDAYRSPICVSDIKQLSKEEVLMKIEAMTKDFKLQKDTSEQVKLISSIAIYAKQALKNKWITQEEMQNMISFPDEDIPTGDALSHAGLKDIYNLESPV